MLSLFTHFFLAASQPAVVVSIDSAPMFTMTTVAQLATAQRAIDSLANTYPFAVSRVPAQEMPRSTDGQITLWTAAINNRPEFTAAVKRGGFASAKSYARARVWLTTAWGLVVAERASRDSGAIEDAALTAIPGLSHEIIGFVRTHERELVALGFAPPPALDVTSDDGRDRFTPSTYVRQFYDSSAHAIRIVTSMESDFLQGFLDSADATPTPSGAPVQPPLRVLFLGNSLTYYHAMPRLFARLAATGLHRRVVAGLVSLPGTSLPHLWDGTDVNTVLQRLPWDVVVMQVRPDGVADTNINDHYAALVGTPVNARGGRTFVWSQYQGPGGSPEFRAIIDTIASAAARAAQGKTAPILDVWDAVRQADTVLWKRLFYDIPHGDMHPSPLGSHLLALSFYKSITGQSPVGLPRTLGDFNVSQADAERLQRIVASVPIH